MKLTDKQQMMVDAMNRDILVSAAAGSGKTATMVETVIDKINDKDDPVDIDEILMVTFSNLAANQMKEKIRARFEEILAVCPENEHIARQLVLVNRADICTIDKFCKKLVMENYDRIGIDAGFSIADDGTVCIMQNEVLDSIFERKYSELIAGEQCVSEYADFGMLCNYICKDNEDDRALRASIVKLYKVAVKQPNPRRWLKEAIAATNVKTVDKLEKQPWVKAMLAQQRRINDSCKRNAEAIRALAEGLNDSTPVDKLLTGFLDKLNNISAQTTYSGMYSAVKASPRLVFYRDKWVKAGENPEIIDKIKSCYEAVKGELASGFVLKNTPEELVDMYTQYRKYYVPLILLTLEFMDEYNAHKKKKKLFEFSDVSHMAYDLVCRTDCRGCVVPTELAKDISRNYRYIFIDEYQDGDYIQEGILTCISQNWDNIHNMYMIGDVKQSIYGFRNARPDIFLGKYNTYKECRELSALTSEDNRIKILLNENFRSRDNVLNAANFVFWQLMDKSMGGLDYGVDTMLVEGVPHPTSPSDLKTEILVAKAYDDITESSLSRDELETAMIAKKIYEILYGDAPMMVLREDYQSILQAAPDMTEDEKKDRLYRRAQPKDIAILLRSVKGIGGKLSSTLNELGIMTNIETSDGYYEATELRIVISLLEVIDNVHQDIPLEAVLVSPVGGMDENEITLVSHYGSGDERGFDLYDRCRSFMSLFERDEAGNIVQEYGRDKLVRISAGKRAVINAAYGKLTCFFEKIEAYRKLSKNVSVSELIWRVITDTGYYEYVYSMPGGSRRKANLDRLVETAESFENGAYKGLFQFLNYIKKYDIEKIDVGEANPVGDDMNAVRIMTMHKSKGLEFPIVFVSRLCSELSVGDKDIGRVKYNNKYYLVGKAIDDVNRYSCESTFDTVVKELEKTESFAEELRILYVAMTRAKEKLYLTGCETRKYADALKKKYSHIGMYSLRLPYDIRFSDAGYMSWIECAYQRLIKLEEGESFAASVTDTIGKDIIANARTYLDRTEYEYKDLEGYIRHSTVARAIDFDRLLSEACLFGDNEYYKDIDEMLKYDYMYSPYTNIGAKYSVTGIKKLAEADEVEVPQMMGEYLDNDVEQSDEGSSIINDNGTTITAGMRGTIVHKFMELIPFEELEEGCTYNDYRQVVETYRNSYVEEHIFSGEEARVIPMYHIGRFFESRLGQRMIRAAKKHELFKEKGFTKTFPASMVADTLKDEEDRIRILELVNSHKEEEDVVLVQGIIDGFFFEGGNVILMDYKTDSCMPEEILNRHKEQLEYYAEVIESLLDKKVTESILYSFHNDVEIMVRV